MPVPEKEQDIKKGSDMGKDKQTDFLDKTGKEKEKTPDKTVSLEIPISGKDKNGLNTSKGKEVEKSIGKDPIGSKDKSTSKDSEDSVNTVRKKDSDNGKIVHYLDKDRDFDSAEKVIDPTNDLDTNIVDIVLIEDKSTIKETNMHKATEKDNRETATEIPQYTIISLRKDEKGENVPYKIDTSSTSNTKETVDSNVIEESLQTLLPKETPNSQPETHKDNSTERSIVPTQSPRSRSVDQEKTTRPDLESPIKENPKTDMGTGAETDSKHTKKEVENLSIIGNLSCPIASNYKQYSKYTNIQTTFTECLFSLFLFRGRGQEMPPTPSAIQWFLRVGAWCRSRDGGVLLQPLICSEWQYTQNMPA